MVANCPGICDDPSIESARQAKSNHELELAERILQQKRAEPADPAMDKYFAMCEASKTEGQSPVLDEYAREVDGRRLTFQVFSMEPQLTKIKGFLSEDEADEFKRIGAPLLKPATVFHNGRVTTASYRTTETGWLKDTYVRKSELLTQVTKRIELVTGMSLASAEEFQVALDNVKNQGKYVPHVDWGTSSSVLRHFKHTSPPPGGRLATFLMYLSDVEVGGYTVFPKLDIRVRPEAGSVLFFMNLMPHRSQPAAGEMLLSHGACPVERGMKYVATKWIHERGNELSYLLPPGWAAGRLFRHWRNSTTVIQPTLIDESTDQEVAKNGESPSSPGCRDAAAVFRDPDGERYTCDDYKSFGYCESSSPYNEFMRRSCLMTCGFCHVAAAVKEEL
eukprot:TRINITY_DN56304_c0_g1_i1.p1 TRINITY_DN56304_c0_g1~~TRINITY_DN56304_c0_g1_i1.p1  ORF type:complete len:454 (+),score=37.92 TRINITY_DN56304_c0_g1_i1:191-1363(+)